MLTFYLTTLCYIVKVIATEDGTQVGLSYLTGTHNSQYSTKFQRAFESIGTALSNQGSKDIDLKVNEHSYPGSEPAQDVNQREVQNGKSFESPDDPSDSVEPSNDSEAERLREHFWTQMFLKHDTNKKNTVPIGDEPQGGGITTYEIQSKVFENSKNNGIEENPRVHQVIQSQDPINTAPIELPVETTPTALYIMKAPALGNGDKEWTANKQNDGQHYRSIPDVRQEFESGNGREKEAEPHYYPQQPILAKPRIQSIEAKCSKEAIHVRVTYDKPFDGTIYAKDHYNDLSCHYVQHKSGQIIFEFSLELNRCGTTLIDEYSSKGEIVLENTLIFQNELNFQEIWDSVRHLRCAWSGVFEKAVQTSVNVNALDSQTITYRGDSVESIMDVQYGHGLNAAPVQGLVRIGDDLTLSVSLIGSDANNFDVRVKDCIAHDGDVRNAVQLTDESGCVLKKKLLGQWQKERDIEDSSVSTFTYMQAFRFPEKMEVYFECNIEICKYECRTVCPEYEDVLIRSQSDKSEDKVKTRTKRTITSSAIKANESAGVEPIRLLRGIRVVVPNDLDFFESRNLSSISKNELFLDRNHNNCVQISSFIISLFVVFISLLFLSLMTAILCLKYFENRNKNSNTNTKNIFR